MGFAFSKLWEGLFAADDNFKVRPSQQAALRVSVVEGRQLQRQGLSCLCLLAAARSSSSASATRARPRSSTTCILERLS